MTAPEELRLRVQLTKKGPARYLSHSEFSRAIMFAARRAGLPLEYAGQFRARMKLSLSPPLPIGVTSECELVDFQLAGYLSPVDAQQALNEAFCGGIEVVLCRLMGSGERPVGKLIDTATYRATFPEEAGAREEWERAVAEFLAMEVVEFERVQPRRTRTLDLRPGVHSLELEDGAGDSPVRIHMALDDGTRGTIKPWEVIEVLARMAGVPRETWERALVNRLGLFARRGDRLVSPMELGSRKPAVSHRGGKRY